MVREVKGVRVEVLRTFSTRFASMTSLTSFTSLTSLARFALSYDP